MAESSLFWSTGSTGDGLNPYTQSQLFDWLSRTFLYDTTQQGIVSGYLNNMLAGATGGTSPSAFVSAGAAMVCGIPYTNTATVTINMTKPVVGTTGYRVVLRANYAAQTVRATLLSSPDGTASYPAVTQNAGVIWDISLATFQLDTTGSLVTITDTRTNAMISATFYNQQGSAAGSWTSPGTTNNAVIKPIRFQIGCVSAVAGTTTVSLPYSSPTTGPVVILTPVGTGASNISLSSVNTSSFVINNAGATAVTVNWIALAPSA